MALVNGLGGEEERLEGSHGAYRSAERTKRSRGALLGRRHTFCHTSEFSGAPRIQVPLFHEYLPMCALLSRVTRRMTIDAQTWRFRLGRPSHLNACRWPFCIWQSGGRWVALPSLGAAAAGVWRTNTGLKSSMFHVRIKAAVLQRRSAGAKRKKEVRRSAVMLVWHSGGQTAIHHHILAQHSSMLGLQRLGRTLSVPSTQQLRNEG